MLQAPNSPPQTRLAYPDAFKFLAIIGVILAHLPATGRFDAGAWGVVETLQQATAWCVLGFFAVSGVLFKAGAVGRPFREELGRRARRLLVPWLAFSALYKVAIPALAAAGMVRTYTPPPHDLPGFASWLLQPADPQLYFLLYLFLIQAFLLLIRRASPVLPVVAGLIAAGLWTWGALQGPLPEFLHGASWKLVLLYLAFFAAGMFCGQSMRRMIGVGLGLSVVAGLLVWTGKDWLIAWQLTAPWMLLMALRAMSQRALLQPLAALGRLSGVVYVWHTPVVMGAVVFVCLRLFGSGLESLAFVVAGTFTTAAVLGLVVNRVRLLSWWHI